MATKKRRNRKKGCSKKRPCKASARSPGYLEGLGRRRHRQLAKSRGKRAKPITAAQARKIGRGRLKAVRKYNRKR